MKTSEIRFNDENFHLSVVDVRELNFKTIIESINNLYNSETNRVIIFLQKSLIEENEISNLLKKIFNLEDGIFDKMDFVDYVGGTLFYKKIVFKEKNYQYVIFHNDGKNERRVVIEKI